MRILFVAPRMIGDVVMSCGILDHLVRTHSEARVTVVAAPEAAALFAAMPGLERTIVFERRRFHRHWPALWADTIGTRWDLAIDLKGSGLPYALWARQRFMRRPMPGVRVYRQHAALLGIEPAPVPVVWTSAADRARAETLIAGDGPVVALCPTASWDPKMWPADRFASLFHSLREHDLPGARAAIFAGPGERERARAEPLLRLLPDAIDLCGRATLPEAAACLARSALAVCNDSGLMHLAAAAGVPTLGLRAHFALRAAPFEPAGPAATWVLRRGDDMAAISVADALHGCRDVLAMGARQSPSEHLASARATTNRTKPSGCGRSSRTNPPQKGHEMLLGLDCGSTAVKAVVFDAEGHALATGSRRTEPRQPEPRRVEHDMDRLWQIAGEAIREALGRAPSREIEAVGVTGHGDGLYLLGRDRRPLGPGIQSVDSRAHDVTADWDASGQIDRIVAITAQRPYPYAASSLLAWIRRHEPERFAAIGHVLFCKDWLRFRLTDTLSTDPTDASTAFTDAISQAYSDDLLSLLGLDVLRPALPLILPSSGVVGTVSTAAAAATGLRQGTPVAGGMHDVTASAVGLGILEPGALAITAGTFSINETLSDHLATDPRWTARAGLRPGQWMNMSISPASSNNVDWLLRQCYGAEAEAAARGGPSLWDAVEADLAAPGGPDAPLFHPYLYGSPHEGPASAAFLGLRSWHTRADMLRAVLEGVTFNHRHHCDALRTAFPVDRARITGGGTSRDRPARLFADTLGLSVEVPEAAEIGALGAALVAGVGVGIYASLAQATELACRIAACHAPDPERHAGLTRRFERYSAMAEALRPHWQTG